MLPGIRISQLTAIGSVTDVPAVGGGSTGRFTPPQLNTANVWTQNQIIRKTIPMLEFLSAGLAKRYAIDANISDAVDGGLRLLRWTGSAYAAVLTARSDGIVTVGAATLAAGTDLCVATGVGVSGLKVVGSRRTGWASPTGAATRTAFATSTVTVAQLAERVKALIDDLTAHGLIGA